MTEIADQKQHPCGTAELYIGPMFSGKTSMIMRKLERACIGSLHCVFIKYADDTRYGDDSVVRAHNGSMMGTGSSIVNISNLRVVKAHRLLDVMLLSGEFDIGVDEGQFYPDLPEAVNIWMQEGRRVYIAALDGDYLRNPFGRINETIPLVNYVRKLTAICMFCNKMNKEGSPTEASYTVRIVKGDAQKMIGAKDEYAAACLKCFLRETAANDR